ncbi:cbb3-type cytochrome oxidase subunit 3 [Halomonas ramblicola]|uniref:cbb3-type cytochrome oxidase subunit 3 n=1 Tax=Halomonas ramblicola TaxID=747349 RepID=UPI0025B4E06F|nr:cbb3-type cytochrome c oxidase subunit 3 [Halomonas ramblicola]MDN3523460.1 cbb3-type cytochrome c oxidase subunit 3 [Halomonas ramblicola]
MDSGTLSGILTGILIIAFLGITAWAYSKRRKKDFDEAANLPFADDDDTPDRDGHQDPTAQAGSDKDASRQVDSRDNEGDRNT